MISKNVINPSCSTPLGALFFQKQFQYTIL